MTLFMPELEKKKRVERLCPDSRRVFSHYDKNEPFPQTLYRTAHTGERPLTQTQSRPRSATRHHKPHPTKVDFLNQDCHLLHEPICEVRTHDSPRLSKVKCMSHKDQNASYWWPTKVESAVHKVPDYCRNTTNRGDFVNTSKVVGAMRHTSNPNTHASKGIVPVTHLPDQRGPRLLVEHISYQHQYDSRQNPTQPTRGKLHGSFVWDVLHPVAQSRGGLQTTSHSQRNPITGVGPPTTVANTLTPADV